MSLEQITKKDNAYFSRREESILNQMKGYANQLQTFNSKYGESGFSEAYKIINSREQLTGKDQDSFKEDLQPIAFVEKNKNKESIPTQIRLLYEVAIGRQGDYLEARKQIEKQPGRVSIEGLARLYSFKDPSLQLLLPVYFDEKEKDGYGRDLYAATAMAFVKTLADLSGSQKKKFSEKDVVLPYHGFVGLQSNVESITLDDYVSRFLQFLDKDMIENPFFVFGVYIDPVACSFTPEIKFEPEEKDREEEQKRSTFSLDYVQHYDRKMSFTVDEAEGIFNQEMARVLGDPVPKRKDYVLRGQKTALSIYLEDKDSVHAEDFRTFMVNRRANAALSSLEKDGKKIIPFDQAVFLLNVPEKEVVNYLTDKRKKQPSEEKIIGKDVNLIWLRNFVQAHPYDGEKWVKRISEKSRKN